jgi:periodic tryptophan protein 1
MITATTWVPRGFAAQFPVRQDVTEEEYERIAELARLQLEDAQEGLDDARAEAGEEGSKKSKKGETEAMEMKDADEDREDKEESVFITLIYLNLNCGADLIVRWQDRR